MGVVRDGTRKVVCASVEELRGELRCYSTWGTVHGCMHVYVHAWLLMMHRSTVHIMCMCAYVDWQEAK